MESNSVFKKKKHIKLNKETLGDLPRDKAVYIIFVKIAPGKNSKGTTNCLHVGETDNLQERIRVHYSDQEPNICLKHFLQSCEENFLLYDSLPNSTKEKRKEMCIVLDRIFEPQCNSPV